MRARKQPDGTRRQILELLCTRAQTTRVLAEQLGISSTAVRKVLVKLEAEGYVRHETVRRGVGKPAHVYSLSAAGEALLSRAYVPVLHELLHVVQAHFPERTVELLLRETGARVAESQRGGRRVGKRTGLMRAVALLNELGGAATLTRTGRRPVIECSCCAVGALVTRHALVCKAVEALVTQVSGERLRERCERNDRPKCRFELVGGQA